MPRKYILIIAIATASVTALAHDCFTKQCHGTFRCRMRCFETLVTPRMHGLGRKNVEQVRVAVHCMCWKSDNEKRRSGFHSAIYSRLCLPFILVEVPDGF